jgi:F-type H+-transporting ATPase subunit epsilon
MGVYPNHIPLTTVLEPCAIRVHTNGEVKKVDITGGFIEIQKAQVTIMAEGAKWKE